MQGMSTDENTAAAELLKRLREPDLPRAVRGLQEEATRSLLAEAASALEETAAERDTLRRETEATGAAGGEHGGATDVEAVGRALVTATSLGEELVASAKEQAEQIVAEARAEAERVVGAAHEAAGAAERDLAVERDRLEGELAGLRAEIGTRHEQLEAERNETLAHARGEVEQILAVAQAEAQRIREEAEGLRATLAARTNAFVGAARAALEQLDELEARRGESKPAGAELLADLRPAEPPNVD